jgi:hypothetical protein
MMDMHYGYTFVLLIDNPHPLLKRITIISLLYNDEWDEWDDEEPEEDDEPEVAEESNFGTFYGFNLRQRIQSRLLDWYLNIHYA